MPDAGLSIGNGLAYLGSTTPTPPSPPVPPYYGILIEGSLTDFLLQEDAYYLLQE